MASRCAARHSTDSFPYQQQRQPMRLDFLPAAGYRNGTSLNNAGTNGNYWSSSLNTSNPNNAYELNFNSGNIDWNNNNRYNGQSVRAVCPSSKTDTSAVVFLTVIHTMDNLPSPLVRYRLTWNQLFADLHQAFHDAARHKHGKHYVQRFKHRLHENLTDLCNDLWTRTYAPQPSTCFLISDPKLREVFAAAFRDRIVHHLYYNYTHALYERTFIHDSYSCIKGRGTHYGIRRLERHIHRESQNYREQCFVLKMDIKGYFMHISRPRLLELCMETLATMARHTVSKASGRLWADVVDMDFVGYLTESIVLLNPVDGCVVRGNAADWKTLPADKSLFHTSKDCGLPIGNLTSQLFSNVYLNRLDQFMKRTVGCRHYGRYVDDFFVVSCDRDWLQTLIPQVRCFLAEELKLQLHEGKSRIFSVRHGVEFLGTYLKPHRRYISNDALRRISRKVKRLARQTDPMRMCNIVNSFLGILGHSSSCRLRRRLFLPQKSTLAVGYYTSYLRKYVLFPKVVFP